jgi:UDP-MurNAc hydroxylase
MKFEFIGNAAGIFHGSNGTTILCDPWVVNGVFEGSWFHYPPIKTKIKDLQNVNAIYVSHIHPDHYDERYFDFPKNTPLIILDEGPNFLKKNLLKKGYTNFIEIKDGDTKNFLEFEITLYKPFTGHIYEESLLGNLIDSAIVLKDRNNIAINFNDNTPGKKACIKLKQKFKKIDLALLNYSAAGPYPACFDNLSEKQKKSESDRIVKRNFDHAYEVISTLDPQTVIPFAGAYVIGGKNYYKNKYLGTATWEECSDYLKKKLNTSTNIVCLREAQIFDIANKKSLEPYKKLDMDHMKTYVESLKNHKYDYEYEDEPDLVKLKKDILEASIKLKERMNKFGIELKSNVFLNIEDQNFQIISGRETEKKITCKMDNRLLRRILDKKSHWNNAEIGTHISFLRTPNLMEPDAHTCLSFFHL